MTKNAKKQDSLWVDFDLDTVVRHSRFEHRFHSIKERYTKNIGACCHRHARIVRHAARRLQFDAGFRDKPPDHHRQHHRPRHRPLEHDRERSDARALEPGFGRCGQVNGARANLRVLSVGQKVRVSAQGNAANEVDVQLELKGAISSIDLTAKTVTVAGTVVAVSTTTRIDLSGGDDSATSTTRTIADLSLGAMIEVTGTRDASGQVLATKIEVKSATELTEDGENTGQGLHGGVSELDLVAGSYKIGSVTVTCAGACKLPNGLKNGDVVEVSGTLDASGTNLSATSVRLEGGDDRPAVPGATVVLEDHARGLNTSAKPFRLEGFAVDYAAATVTGTLAERTEVSVTRTVDVTDVKLVHTTTVAVRVENR